MSIKRTEPRKNGTPRTAFPTRHIKTLMIFCREWRPRHSKNQLNLYRSGDTDTPFYAFHNNKMKSLQGKDEICVADEIHFVNEIKSVLSSAARRISSQRDFIHCKMDLFRPRTDLIEKTTFVIKQKWFFHWSGLRDSNSPPPPWQGGALPDELNPQVVIEL